ncbi:MAG: hypothetical protein AVO35_12645 [Candidatus Aegiribacteria sp. MLS_C]|nr:MAG: hypothetical protein AVO35_12645 [Candidatus Aegiribacteria sp. MLS_C]
MYLFLACSLILTPSTPEEFLLELCENSSGRDGAEYWSEHASDEVQRRLADPDSLQVILDDRHELSVDPGPRTAFVQEGDNFRIEFGRSSWTWRDLSGETNRKEGVTVVLVISGEYSWSSLPVLEQTSLRIGNRERLMSGLILTFLLLTAAVVLVAWAKRRYL